MDILRVQQKYDNNIKECTFKPNISLNDDSDDSVSVITRLTENNEKPINKEMKRRVAWEDELNKKCTFTPHINSLSNKIVEEKYKDRPIDFVERQQYYELERLKKDNKNKNIYSENEYTFKPEIGNAEDILIYKRPELILETSEERIERLSKKDSEKREYLNKKYINEFILEYKMNIIINFHLNQNLIKNQKY